MSGGGVIPVTVVMRSYNEAEFLPRTLAALDAQRGVEVRLAVFESASIDHSLALIEAHGYARLEELAPGSYHSSRVLNDGVEAADTELVAFVNSDAVMLTEDTLVRLARVLLEDEGCAGVFARQVVRADAGAMTRLEYATAFGDRRALGEHADDLSLVCSMIRKSAWREVPFDARLTYAEDAVWSREVRARGWRTVYVPEAVAEHSHNYTAEQRYRRAFGDSAALAVLAERAPSRALLWPWFKRCLREGLRCLRLGRPHWAVLVPGHFWPLVRGARDGACDGFRRWRSGGEDAG